jgi:hypothetical protein
MNSQKLWEMLWALETWFPGEAHPRCYMTDVVLVLPNSFRLWSRDEHNNYKSNSSSQEVQSNTYQEIFILTQKVEKEKNPQDREILLLSLFQAVNNMLMIKGVKRGSMFEKKGVLNSLVNKKKTGLIRNIMMGNTVFACGRAVVIGFSNMPVDHIGLPEIMCRELLFPEKVTHFNIDKLRKLVLTKQATFVTTPEGQRYIVNEALKHIACARVEVGGTVDRMLDVGDVAIINRQPTLHQGSMMCFYITRIAGHAIRINPLVAAPFNADYDGDEMNLHVPVSQETRAEIIEIMHMKHRIMGDSGGCQIGLVQNPLLGVWKLSSGTISRDLFHQYTGIFSDEPEVEGWRVIAHIFRAYTLRGKVCNDEGKIVRGPIGNAEVGTGGSFIKQVWWVSMDGCVDVLNQLQRVGDHFIDHQGTSVGITDLRCDVRALKEEFNKLEQSHSLQYAQDSIRKKFEDNRGDFGGFDQMNKAESKKSNLRSLVLFLGTQIVNGKPIPKYIQNERILPTMVSDKTPRERGFVEHSFLDGLDITESTLALQDGRCGIINRSVNTYTAGSKNRSLSYRLSSYVVNYDFTVRDATGRICQFLYGGDGIDPRYSGAVAGRGYPEYRPGVLLRDWGVPDPDRYRLDPGTPIGLIAAHAMGQPVTQAVLNSLHSEGELTEQAVPRLEELLKMTANPCDPRITVVCPSVDRARSIRSALHSYRFSKWEIREEGVWWEEIFDKTFGSPPPNTRKLWVYLRDGDRDLLLRSDQRYMRLDPRAEILQLFLEPGESPRSVIDKVLTRKCPRVTREGNVLTIHTKEPFQWFLTNLPDDIPRETMFSNSLHDVAKTLGLMTMRELLYREFVDLEAVNSRHASFFSDVMTYQGIVSPINLKGIQNTSANEFVCGSFYNPIGTYIGAAVNNTHDRQDNILYQVGFGQKIRSGTGFDFTLEDGFLEPDNGAGDAASETEWEPYAPSFD